MITTLKLNKSLATLGLLAATLGLMNVTPTYASERGSAEEVKTMIDDALKHIKANGAEKAFQDFSTPGGKWQNKDIYLFAYKFDGVNVAHGANKALIGKNLLELKTADGQTLIKNMIDVAKTKGNGWIEYKWPHPQTKAIEDKKAYVVKIPEYEGLIGAGIYK
jgi:cytochrome c